MNVTFCVDRGFTLPLAVALASLDAASAGEPTNVFVFHPGLVEASITKIQSRLKHLTVQWIRVDEAAVAGAHFSTFLSAASLYRLLIGELLPADMERVIYVDADTVVLDSLAGLYAQDLGDKLVGAVRDAGSPWAAGAREVPWRELGLDADGPYLNSGVMLVDLNRWREADVGNQTLSVLRKIKPVWGDQDGLNAVLKDSWVEVSRRWNLQTDDVRESSLAWAVWRQDVEASVADPAIIHYTGLEKPWHYGCRHPRTSVWNAWLQETAWAGWEPSRPRPSRIDQAGRRVIEIARRLRKRRDHALPA